MRRSDYLEEMKNNFLTFFGCVSTESTETERLEIEDIIKKNEIQLEKITSTTSTTEFTQESSQEIVTGEKPCDKEIAETIDGIVSLVIQTECSYVLPETDDKNNDEKVVIDKFDNFDEAQNFNPKLFTLIFKEKVGKFHQIDFLNYSHEGNWWSLVCVDGKRPSFNW